MAGSVSHPLLSFYSHIHQSRCCLLLQSTIHTSPTPISSFRKPTLSPSSSSTSTSRIRSIPKSSPQKNPITKTENSSESESKFKDDSSNLFSGTFPLNVFSRLLHRLRNELKVDELGLEILSIALPAVLALAADPIALLVDSAFVGHLGSVELAAVGVSISVFNLVSKLFNVPLLNITTSFVAEEQALVGENENDSLRVDTSSTSGLQEMVVDKQRKLLLPSVSASLVLAAGVGIAEAVALCIGSGFLMNIMGFTNAGTCRAVSYSKSFWCSANSNSTCSTRHFPWIYGYKDTFVCCRCWKLTECDIGSYSDISVGSGHWWCCHCYSYC
eukprot:TRINITY_DN14026_c0_g1_i5.p1 TRINITY_DN14026_c0_g1~~TRINITY_DN14026_c0_g1_i5.p1  ORF type:complete len:345 (+),score=55.23 TRINITY_DN14026_c0_g1_i5:50-1036(+)